MNYTSCRVYAFTFCGMLSCSTSTKVQWDCIWMTSNVYIGDFTVSDWSNESLSLSDDCHSYVTAHAAECPEQEEVEGEEDPNSELIEKSDDLSAISVSGNRIRF